jgi:hypothetical protein
MRANRYFCRAARANQTIFYSRGRPRTVAQVYKNLVGSHMKLQATAESAKTPASPVPEQAKLDAPRSPKPVKAPVQSPIPTAATQETRRRRGHQRPCVESLV